MEIHSPRATLCYCEYFMHIYSVTDFTAELSEAKCLKSTWRATTRFFEKFGLDGVVYLDVDGADFTLHSTLPQSWHQHYIDSEYQKIDSFAQICCTSSTPVLTGADNLDLYPNLTKAQETLVLEAGETGFRAGFSSCFRQASANGYGGWNFLNSEGKKANQATLDEHGSVLHLAAFCAHQALSKIPCTKDAPALSAREIECLQWLATGFRTQQIAYKMDLKPVTIDFHFRRARKKLGVKTREHALAKAISLSLVSI